MNHLPKQYGRGRGRILLGYASVLLSSFALWTSVNIQAQAPDLQTPSGSYTNNASRWIGLGNKPWTMMHTNVASSSSAEVKIGPAANTASSDVSSISAASVIGGCPQNIDSTAFVEGTVDDRTEHTYVVPAGPIGSFADCQIIRTFGAPIQSIQVMIESGQADDIGYVGNTQVTDTKPMCAAIGEVLAPVDVTDQVSVNENTATLLLRARENCCCETGWGEATAPGRLNAKLHWSWCLLPNRLRSLFLK